MMLNIHFECLPGQHAQVDSLCAFVREALEKQGVASEYASQFFRIMEDAKSPLGIAEALVEVEKGHSLNLRHGVSLVPGTFPTYAARALEKDTHQDLTLAMLAQSLRGLHQSMVMMGYMGPGVIVMTTRPPQAEYNALVEDQIPWAYKRHRSVWWTDGYEALKGLIDQASVWLGRHTRVVVVDPRKPTEAVNAILGVLSPVEWARYAQTTTPVVSDYDRFMGFDAHTFKLPKKYIQSLEGEAKHQHTTLDALVTSILKKHLMGDIIPSTGDSS